MSEPLELELQRVVSHHVGVRASLLEEQPVPLTVEPSLQLEGTTTLTAMILLPGGGQESWQYPVLTAQSET